jgi:hypothetical protein
MFARLFPHNEAAVDRLIRIGIGVALLTLALTGPKSPWGFLGIVPLLTGILGSCPAYTLLGVSTCPLTTHRKTT